MKEIFKKISDYFLIIVFFIITLIGVFTLIKTPEELSYLENRKLYKFSVFNLNDFSEGFFQENLENAYLDQFVGSETIKTVMLDKLSLSNKTMAIKKICDNSYVKIKGDYYTYDCDKRIINAPFNIESNIDEILEEFGKKYSTLHDKVDVYYYYVTTSSNFNLYKNKFEVDIPKLVDKYWKGNYHFDYLEINDYEDIQKYFYTTDHHLNHVGSQKIYKDIMNMFNITKVIEPIEEVFFDFKFTGSSAKATMFYDYDDNFKAYRYNLPKHTTYLDDTIGIYGNEEDYFNGLYSQSSMTNHYGVFYGEDNAEVMFDYNNPDEENLLIIGNSYSNSVNKLIASHFNKTYDIDLRTYFETFEEIPDMDKYINDYDIDKVLVIMDYSFLTNEMSLSWEEL